MNVKHWMNCDVCFEWLREYVMNLDHECVIDETLCGIELIDFNIQQQIKPFELKL